MNDLQSATTEEILDELRSRFPVLVFGAMREFPGKPEADQRILVFRGNLMTALGLAAVSVRHIQREIDEVEFDADE